MIAVPIRNKLRVRVLPQADRSFLYTPTKETPLRRCEITALGPDANARKSPQLAVGQVVLVNILAGQHFGAEVVVPNTAVVAIYQE